MASDEEGNNYSPLFNFEEGLFVRYEGVFPLELTEEVI
jgi:hypothetical protein